MARPAAHSPDDLQAMALEAFWGRSFDSLGMADLLRLLGTNRHSFYAAFGSKRAAYLACFARYQTDVVTPALAPVEAPGAGLNTIAGYFETQITLAEEVGLPGPGCFVANATGDMAATDDEVRQLVRAHETRLQNAFAAALTTGGHPAPQAAALHTTIFAQGLWLQARTVSSAAPLRQAATTHMTQLSDQCA